MAMAPIKPKFLQHRVKPSMIESFSKPKAMVIGDRAVTINNLTPNGTYQEFRELGSGKIVGLREGNYTLLEGKNGDLIEQRLSNPLMKEPFSSYKVVTGKDGKLKSLSEERLGSSIKLTQGVNNEIISNRVMPEPTYMDAVNAVRRYEGLKPF